MKRPKNAIEGMIATIDNPNYYGLRIISVGAPDTISDQLRTALYLPGDEVAIVPIADYREFAAAFNEAGAMAIQRTKEWGAIVVDRDTEIAALRAMIAKWQAKLDSADAFHENEFRRDFAAIPSAVPE